MVVFKEGGGDQEKCLGKRVHTSMNGRIQEEVRGEAVASEDKKGALTQRRIWGKR